MRAYLFSLPVACVLFACSTSSTPGTDGGVVDDASVPSDGSKLDYTPSDSAMVCAPQELTDFMPPAFIPPVPQQNVCSPAQIQAFYDKCVGDQGSQMTCALWQAGNVSCSACLASADSQTAWGALVLRLAGYDANRSGCVATLGYLDCAKKLDVLWACTAASCEEACPPDPNDGGLAGYEACRTAASTSVCKMYRTNADAVCPTDASSLSFCLQEGLQKFYLAFAPILCSSGG